MKLTPENEHFIGMAVSRMLADVEDGTVVTIRVEAGEIEQSFACKWETVDGQQMRVVCH